MNNQSNEITNARPSLYIFNKILFYLFKEHESFKNWAAHTPEPSFNSILKIG
jgi:hypothetical protein